MVSRQVVLAPFLRGAAPDCITLINRPVLGCPDCCHNGALVP